MQSSIFFVGPTIFINFLSTNFTISALGSLMLRHVLISFAKEFLHDHPIIFHESQVKIYSNSVTESGHK